MSILSHRYGGMRRGSDVFDILLNLSAKDMAVELMYINMHVQGDSLTHITLELTATKNKAHIWKSCAYRMLYL